MTGEDYQPAVAEASANQVEPEAGMIAFGRIFSPPARAPVWFF
jgi:hypothetical protein